MSAKPLWCTWAGSGGDKDLLIAHVRTPSSLLLFSFAFRLYVQTAITRDNMAPPSHTLTTCKRFHLFLLPFVWQAFSRVFILGACVRRRWQTDRVWGGGRGGKRRQEKEWGERRSQSRCDCAQHGWKKNAHYTQALTIHDLDLSRSLIFFFQPRLPSR